LRWDECGHTLASLTTLRKEWLHLLLRLLSLLLYMLLLCGAIIGHAALGMFLLEAPTCFSSFFIASSLRVLVALRRALSVE